MITNDRLLVEVGDGLQRANRITQVVFNQKMIRHKSAVRLVKELRRAMCAAQELERRAAGVPPAKEG